MRPYIIDKNFDLQRLVDANGNPVFDSASLAVYVQDPAPSIPDGFGLGVLIDAISCAVKTELNGMDELTLTYPIIGQNYEHLQLRNIIVAGTAGRGNQPYRIYRITKPLNGVVTVYARHLVYDLAGIVVKPYTAQTVQDALAGLVNNAMTLNPFSFVTGRTTNARFTVPVPTSVWSLLGGTEGSLLDVYGGEYLWEGYTVSLYNRVGADRGVSVRYGVNMTDLEQDASCADCYTGVVAYWQQEDDVVYSPVVSAAGSYGYVKILSVDMSSKFEDKPTAAQLTTAAEQYIVDNEIGIPRVSWIVEFVPLSMTEEYKAIAPLTEVGLGDTVTVFFERLGVDATARARCIEWDSLRDRYISVELGSVRANIADTIATQAQEIKNAPTRAEVASLSTLIAAGIMGARGGSVRFLDTDNDGEPDTLYIANNKDPALATRVWRWNYEGWAASDNGYDGPFRMGATLDGGIIADFITAGLIQSRDGSFTISLDTGVEQTTGTKTYIASDYSEADATRISQILLGNITPTQEDYDRYDIYQDGEITTTDLVKVRHMINTGQDLTIEWSARIEPSSRGAAFSVWMNGSRVARIGVNIMEAQNGKFPSTLETGILLASSGEFSGAVRCHELWVNGRQIT